MKNLDTCTIVALRQQGESLVRTEETKRVLHRVGQFVVHGGDRADHFDLYVSHENGRRVPESGHYSLEAAKRHADACAVVLAGVVLPVAAERGVEFMQAIRVLASKSEGARL